MQNGNVLPPPRTSTGSFIGGNKPPGGGFAKFQHLQDQRVHTYDGKRMRKAVQRKVIDFNSEIIRYLQGISSYPQPIPAYVINYKPPRVLNNPVDSVTMRFAHTSTNKIRCPVNVAHWTPDGRRLITGSTSGEFTLWNGFSFNFETILQAHDSAVRAMTWSNNSTWMLTCDHLGIIKYWQSNMNNLKAFQGHKEPVRGISFAPSDSKFVSCSDDATLKIWDFAEAKEESILTGHGWDVKCVDWHPRKALIASGGKDNLIKLWDPRTSSCLSTLHGHKNTILSIDWNKNGNYLLAGSRDQIIKVYDIRTLKEIQGFKKHLMEVDCVKWHSCQENLFASGGSDGYLYFWVLGEKEPVGMLESAHESNIWALAWHPLGHILASSSNDHTTKFWTRHRPGDRIINDQYVRPRDSVHVVDKSSNSNNVKLGATSFNLRISGVAIPGLQADNGETKNFLSEFVEQKIPSNQNPSLVGIDIFPPPPGRVHPRLIYQ